MPIKRTSEQGFTYIELVTVIAIMAIISVGVVRYIASSAEGYVRSAERNQLTTSGRILIDRLALELHNAVPNSVRITPLQTAASARVLSGHAEPGDQCIEFVPVRAATIYINPSFSGPGSGSFNVVRFQPNQQGGPFSSPRHAIIYPIATASLYTEPPPVPPSGRGPRREVSGITAHATLADVDTITLDASHRFAERSPQQRLYLGGEPVSFCLVQRRLFRYSGYGFHTSQLWPENIGGGCNESDCLPSATPGRVLIGDNIDNRELAASGQAAFNVLSASTTRNGLVQMSLNLSSDNDSLSLSHEVLLQNTP